MEKDFDILMAQFIDMVVAVNAICRSMGVNDMYPFVLCTAAKTKLRFVHDVIMALSGGHEAQMPLEWAEEAASA